MDWHVHLSASLDRLPLTLCLQLRSISWRTCVGAVRRTEADGQHQQVEPAKMVCTHLEAGAIVAWYEIKSTGNLTWVSQTRFMAIVFKHCLQDERDKKAFRNGEDHGDFPKDDMTV